MRFSEDIGSCFSTQSSWEPNSVESKRHSQIVNIQARYLNVHYSYVFSQDIINVHFFSST